MQPTFEQQRVIWHWGGPLLVLAVAGSGKTTCLLWLVRRLVTGFQAPDGRWIPGIDPATILMTTFSKRAAEDMSTRAEHLGAPGVDYRTLHSVGFEMARSQSGLRQGTVPAGWQLARVARDAINEATREGFELERPLRPGDALREIANAKAALIWPDAWTAWNGSRFPGYVEWATARERDPLDDMRADMIARCYHAIESAAERPEEAGFKRDSGYRWVSFDDQVAVPARAILRHGPADAWVRGWQGHFAWVLVDEIQDNNLAQWTVCEFLARHRNIVCVGDDQQAIFVWRGARPELMRVFLERHPDAAILPLSFNFRSGQEILDLANKALSFATDRLYLGLLQKGREGDAPAVVRVQKYATAEEEAHAIADEIKAAIERGVSPSCFAAMTRIKASLGALELWFIRLGIPYRIAGSSFFSRGEVRAAVAYIALALDENDEDAFARACAAPTRYLGREFLETYPSLPAARQAQSKLGRWGRGVRELTRAVQEIKVKLKRERGLAAALDHIFDRVGVRRFFRDEDSDEEDATEVDEACAALVHCASTLETPEELVRFARSMATTGRESPDEEPEQDPDRVTLTTIHKAKALEWDRVYLAGCTAGLLPLRRAPLPEERRLFYVAVTRARDLIAISWAETTTRGSASSPSRFLIETGLVEDLPVEPLPLDGGEPEPKPVEPSVPVDLMADF